MAVEKNIVMKEFNGTDYDTLYPKTIGTQVDGVFTSEQTLTSNTLAKYQLSASAVPDDVFAWLGKYAQYWWGRRQPTTVYTTTESPSTKQVYIIYKPGSTSATRPINYSDSISVDQSTGTISLVNPQTVDVSYSNRGSTIDETLAGKYVTNLYTDPSTVYKFATTPAYSRDTSRYSLYFSSGDVTVVSSVGTPGYTDWEYVQSNNRNAYPDSGESGGYEYEFLGKPLDNAVTAPKIETGSYVGTGTYGQNNPNTLTFSKKPKLVLFGSAESVDTQGYTNQGFIYYGITTIFTTNTSSDYINYVTYSGNTMSWYCMKSELAQYNNQNTTYYYTVFY